MPSTSAPSRPQGLRVTAVAQGRVDRAARSRRRGENRGQQDGEVY